LNKTYKLNRFCKAVLERAAFLQKGLPIDRKYGIVEWYGIILVLYSDKGVLSGTLFYEQLAADVREAGENPAQFRYRVGECHADATGIL
jgi:hypothetical protein